MNYDGKWYNNLTGNPDHISFVIESHPSKSDAYSVDHLILSRTQLNRYTHGIEKRWLDAPMKPFEIEEKKVKHKLIDRIFRFSAIFK